MDVGHRPSHSVSVLALSDSEPSAAFGALVPPLLAGEVELGPRLPRLRGEALGELDALAGSPRRSAERELGIDVHEPRDVDDGEEEVAELRLDPLVWLGLRRGPPRPLDFDEQLAQLLVQLLDRPSRSGQS